MFHTALERVLDAKSDIKALEATIARLLGRRSRRPFGLRQDALLCGRTPKDL
jgi:hypothetical protein